MSNQSETELLQAYAELRKGKPSEANRILSSALVYELDNKEILFAINCCNFWQVIIDQYESMADTFERAELLINEWNHFLEDKEQIPFERTVYAVKCGVFSLALTDYVALNGEKDPEHKAEILRKTGLCYKKLGEYENSRNFLTEANTIKPGSSVILAELADCYALCGEERQAKVLFREAFYIAPQKIEPAFLDSELINCLIRNVREKGYSGAQLLEWIPVYGHLFGVFTVKRRLRPQEVGRLKQEIYARENEMKTPGCQSEILTPHLINLYFWLIDYYVMANEEIRSINEILTRIKILDPAIYELYVK